LDLTVPDELWELIKRIPPGRCTSYGALGKALFHPATGRMVGRWMRGCPDDIPWWRVVNAQGATPVWKIDPRVADMQKQLLKDEGATFKGDSVDLGACYWNPE
jgi:methylated-DNA-protein-cysteine methyltransferase-like protein